MYNSFLIQYHIMHRLGQNLMGNNCISKSKLRSLLFQLVISARASKQPAVLVPAGRWVCEVLQLAARTAPLLPGVQHPVPFTGWEMLTETKAGIKADRSRNI